MGTFSKTERGRRLIAIRDVMKARGVDVFLSMDGPSIRYATGFRGEPHALLLTGEAAILHTSYRTMPWAEAQTEGIELVSGGTAIEAFRKRLGTGSVIGVDSGIGYQQMKALQSDLSSHTVQISTAIDEARRIKSSEELALLQRSQDLNEEVFAAVLERLRPGLTERGAQGLILGEIAGREELDGVAFAPIVAAGANAWEIHHLPDHSPLETGDMVIIDLGVVYQGYASDMTRMVCFGEPTARMREVHETVLAAQRAAFGKLRAGVTNHEVDRAARQVIEEAGFGRGFTHGLGHGIGLQTHDPGVALSPRAPETVLEEGMVFTVEPGTYLEGEFGVRIEDTVVVERDGHRRLTKLEPELLELPG
jgi:Xaa-Pro aminopeptidase